MPSSATAKVAEGVGNAPTSADADPVFETGAASLYLPAFQQWSGWQELHLRPPGPKPGALKTELRIQKWWEVLVTLQSSLPACLKTPDLQAGSRITSRMWERGWELRPRRQSL